MKYNDYTLNDVCSYRNEKVNVSEVVVDKYISTDNMVPEKGGVYGLSTLPSSGKVNSFQAGDTLISNIRPYFKKIWFSKSEGGCSADVLVFNANPTFILPQYLYYFLSQDVFFDYMVKTSKGTKMPRGDKNAVLKYPISLPSLSYQNLVVNILSKLDEKVEVNKKLIIALEELSQSLFKRWFIDFEFANKEGLPYKSSGGKMVDSELGEIPEGWEVISIDDVTQVVSKGTTPRTKDLEVYEEDKFALFLKVRDISDTGEINFSSLDKIPLSIHENQLKRSKLLEKDLLVSIAGTIGRISYVPKNVGEINANQAVAFLRLKSMDLFSYIYMLIKSEDFAEYLFKKIVQAVQANVSLTTLKEYKLVLPNADMLTNWKSIADDFIKQVEVLRVENFKLIELRDTLLPKLISGEIKIPDESVVV